MDIFGSALQDQFIKGKTDTLWLHNSYDEPEEMPVDIFFRKEHEMPELELKALELCRGSILDVGAGAGSHTLLLQERRKDVTALDISPKAVDIMKKRGVKNAIEQDIFTLEGIEYDTLLFLMNGIGITGTLAGFKDFLLKAKSYLHKGGQLIFDSSDLTYLYQEIELPTNKYYGEVAYQYEYQKIKGNWFNWLYIDQVTLANLALECGWDCKIIMEDDYDQYLAQLIIN